MRQIAWLELDGEDWCFLQTIEADLKKAARKWADIVAAKEGLLEEGWTVAEAYPEQIPGLNKPHPRIFGYCLTRTIH